MHLEQKVRWSEEEITFLKFSYPNKEFTLDEIIKALPNRSKAAIQQKAHSLGLHLYNPPKPPDGFKKCTSCDTILPLDFFHNNKNYLDGKWFDCNVECCRAFICNCSTILYSQRCCFAYIISSTAFICNGFPCKINIICSDDILCSRK